ncbi:EAL domain-containing protein [soil metagenome]
MSTSRNRRILVIDDNASIHEDVRKILSFDPGQSELDAMQQKLFGVIPAPQLGTTYEVDSAHQGEEGYKMVCDRLARGEQYAAAFIDMRMPPGWDGVETIEKIWSVDPSLEIVICTAYSDHSWEEIVGRLGSTDRLLILKKPFDMIEVSQLASSLTQKWHLAKQAASRLEALEEAIAERTTELQAVNAKLHHDSTHDRLTGLANRSHVSERIQHCIQRAKRKPTSQFALLFLDLDRFKLVNDILGHGTGDMLLRLIAERLAQSVREEDLIARDPIDTTLARLGGDEFIILLEDLHSAADAARVAERIEQAVSRPCVIDGHEIVTSVSIGVAPGSSRYENAEELLRDADAAMYRAKASGRGRYAIFDATLHQQAKVRLQLESDLRHALARNELILHYQPIMSLQTSRLVGFEALLRWKHPERGMVSPGEFIAVAEDIGSIVPIGAWVTAEACKQLSAWQVLYPELGLTMSVNLSRKQLSDAKLVPTIQEVLQRTGVSPSDLKLEITESVMMEDTERNCQVLGQIKALGVQLDMDDFGTGYSSLSCINRFPLDGLKIDRAFIQSMVGRKPEMAVINAILALAKTLGIRVVAEGVETIEQAALLQSLKCDQVQGYFFSRPLDAAAAEQFISVQRDLAKAA